MLKDCNATQQPSWESSGRGFPARQTQTNGRGFLARQTPTP